VHAIILFSLINRQFVGHSRGQLVSWNGVPLLNAPIEYGLASDFGPMLFLSFSRRASSLAFARSCRVCLTRCWKSRYTVSGMNILSRERSRTACCWYGEPVLAIPMAKSNLLLLLWLRCWLSGRRRRRVRLEFDMRRASAAGPLNITRFCGRPKLLLTKVSSSGGFEICLAGYAVAKFSFPESSKSSQNPRGCQNGCGSLSAVFAALLLLADLIESDRNRGVLDVSE
jgi:hypothetical protein